MVITVRTCDILLQPELMSHLYIFTLEGSSVAAAVTIDWW
jgi:hypothetical protein